MEICLQEIGTNYHKKNSQTMIRTKAVEIFSPNRAGGNYDVSRSTSEAARKFLESKPYVEANLKEKTKTAPMADLTNGAAVRSLEGGYVDAFPVQTTQLKGRMNPVAVWTAQNQEATNQTLRIGGIAGLASVGEVLGIGPGAADAAGVLINGNPNAGDVQAFSRLISHKFMLIDEIQIITDDLTQLNRNISYNTIFPTDLVVHPNTTSIAFTQQKSDFRDDKQVAYGSWLLSSDQYFEYILEAGVTVTIILHGVAVNNVENYTLI